MTSQTIKELRTRLDKYARQRKRGLRILATHHPIAFPWESNEIEVGPIQQMKLLDADKKAKHLRNDLNHPPGLTPWFHLLISGHTHLNYPVSLPQDVTQITQGPLSDYQLQVVGGALMLNAKRRTAPNQSRTVKGYSYNAVDQSPCQASILRFYATGPHQIMMHRFRIASVDGGQHYAPTEVSETFLYF